MEELAGERPDDYDNAYDLANTYQWFFSLYWEDVLGGRLYRVGPAEETVRHALALFEKLLDDFPDRPGPLSKCARVGTSL